MLRLLWLFMKVVNWYMPGYDHYINGSRPEYRILSNMLSMGWYITGVKDTISGWNKLSKAAYFKTVIQRPENRILNSDTVPDTILSDCTIVTGYNANFSCKTEYLFPSGLLFMLYDNLVSNEQVRLAEIRWQKNAAYL